MLVQEPHENYALASCHHCDQAFLQHFKEVGRFGADEDLWTRWVAISDDEKERLEMLLPQGTNDWSHTEVLCALFRDRIRLVQYPDGHYRWTDGPFDPCDGVPPGWT